VAPLERGSEHGCEEWSQEVTLFVDGELADVDRVAVEGHLATCAVCRSAARFQQAFRAALRTKLHAHISSTPVDLKSRLEAALDEEPTPAFARPPAPHFAWGQLKKLWSPVPVAAAGATALGITAWLWFGNSKDDVVKDLVARHSRQLPLEIQSSDPRSLEQWLNGKVDFRVRIPQLSGKPLSLVGARLSHVKDRAAVHLLYGTTQSPQHQVSMLVYDDSSNRPVPVAAQVKRVDDHDVYLANSAGYNVAIWKDNEVVYSLVSDTDDDVLDLVRAAAHH
jgi:anti-sigma factor RsiW